MGEIDELEAIAEQLRYGSNGPRRGRTKQHAAAFHRAQHRGAAEARSIGKQQVRSSQRRGVLVKPENQD